MARSLSGLSFLVLSILACDGADPGPQGRPPSVPPAAPPAQVRHDRYITLQRHEPASATATYLPIEIGDGAEPTVRPLAPRERPAMRDDAYTQPYHRTAVAADGDTFARAEAVTAGEASTYRLVVERLDDPGDEPSATIDLGEIRPVALHVVRGVVYVGADRLLGYVDPAERPARFHQVVQRTLHFEKPYDLFVRSGDHLLAIDDQVFPIFADLLRIDRAGRPSRLADLRMPGIINGHYVAAALVPAGPDAFTLYAILPFGVIDGNGHTLATMHLRGGAVEPDHETTLNSSPGAVPGVLEEFVPRAHPGDPPRILFGTEMTEWRAVAVAPGGEVLVAADGRGLFVFPASFSAADRPRVVDLGGACRDVRAWGERVFALVTSGEGGELVVLRRGSGGIAVASRHRLPAAYDRFVR